jgi:hypothetical protein
MEAKGWAYLPKSACVDVTNINNTTALSNAPLNRGLALVVRSIFYNLPNRKAEAGR